MPKMTCYLEHGTWHPVTAICLNICRLLDLWKDPLCRSIWILIQSKWHFLCTTEGTFRTGGCLRRHRPEKRIYGQSCRSLPHQRLAPSYQWCADAKDCSWEQSFRDCIRATWRWLSKFRRVSHIQSTMVYTRNWSTIVWPRHTCCGCCHLLRYAACALIRNDTDPAHTWNNG